MSLTGVKMSEEVWLTCLTHALSTETEEIMGVLLGDIQSKNGSVTALIWGASPQPRCDPRKDRVEIQSSLLLHQLMPSFPVFGCSIGDKIEQDTADSRAIVVASKDCRKSRRLGGFFANSDAGKGNNYHANSLNNAVRDLDPVDIPEGVKEAMHRSNMVMSRAEFVRKEIPLRVLPLSTLLSLSSPLSSFTNLQHVLYEEEKSAYNQPRNNAKYELKVFAEEAQILESELSIVSPSNSSSRSPSQRDSKQRLCIRPT